MKHNTSPEEDKGTDTTKASSSELSQPGLAFFESISGTSSPYLPLRYSSYANPGYAEGDPWRFRLVEDSHDQGKGASWALSDSLTYASLVQCIYYISQVQGDQQLIRVIDVGSGDGVWSVRLLLEFKQLLAVCVEPNPALLDFAYKVIRQHYPQVFGRIAFVEGNLCSLPFDENVFDIGLCLYDPLNHVPRAQHVFALQELHRVVRGCCCLSVHAINAPGTCYVDDLGHVSHVQQDPTNDILSFERDGELQKVPSHLFSVEELLSLYKAANLHIMDFYGQDVVWTRMVQSSRVLNAETKRQLLGLEQQMARDIHLMDFSTHLFVVSSRTVGLG